MFCSLCKAWEPCGKPDRWIEPFVGYEYRKVAESGRLRGNARPVKTGPTMRPCNCDPALGTKAHCPHCGQFHLRPGYCQALDPAVLNEDTEPVFTPDEDTEPVLTVLNEELEIEPDAEEADAEAKRKAYKLEWQRKRRAAKRVAEKGA